MKLTQKIIAILILQVLLFSCSYRSNPKPIITLEPISKPTKWLFGQEFTNKLIDDVEISIAFYRAIDDIYIFDTEIKNFSNDTILVQPEKISYYPLQEADTVTSGKTFVKNPEDELVLLDDSIAQENHNYGTQVTVDAVFTILNFALTIAASNEEELYDSEEMEIDLEESRISRDDKHDKNLTDLNKKRDEWEIGSLRKTSLEPSTFMQGRIYFPANNKSKIIKITIPIGNRFFEFLYKIKVRYLY